MVKMDKIVNFAMQIFNNRIESGVMDGVKRTKRKHEMTLCRYQKNDGMTVLYRKKCDIKY